VKLHERIRASLFIKILLLFIVAFVAIVGVSSFLHFYLILEQRFPAIQRNSLNYCSLVADKIGTPPDTVLAAALADSLKINIRIQSAEYHWASRATVPEFGESDIPAFNEVPGSHVGVDHGMIVEFPRGEYFFTFQLERREEGFIYTIEIYGVLLLLAFTLVLVGVYVIIRRILKPLHALDVGVQELARGNLDHTIALKRRDELGELVKSFNMMAARLRIMLQARDRLLLDVSHELRSPLTRMKVATEFLENDDLRKNLNDDISSMDTMVTEILETARLKSAHGDLHLKDVNLGELLRDAAAEFEDSKPGVTVHVPAEAAVLRGDADRLRILLRNVLGNALKFTPDENVPVSLTMERRREGGILVTVKDTGSGIPAEDLPFVFEPFYRVDKSRAHGTGGYGLGLSLCKTIIEQHGGSIDISSSPDEGTTVLLSFPLH